MKLNNKGFAITGFLYSIFAIFLVILSMLIISMTNSKLTLDKVKKNVKNSLDEVETTEGYYEKSFSYTGSEQSFTVPYTGWYFIELWGARGGSNNGLEGSTGNYGGSGAYVSGKTYLTKNEVLYFYVGGIGGYATAVNSDVTKGYNGGGYAGYDPPGVTPYYKGAGGGGGATDVRLINGAWNNSTSLASRIMIAGGGGGVSNWLNPQLGGHGGTLIGNNGKEYNAGSNSYSNSSGGTQLTGGNGAIGLVSGSNGSFGIGGNSSTPYGGGGGSGYYGGGGGSYNISVVGSGAGGSSFISGYAGVNAITSQTSLTATNNTTHYSGKYFINGIMQAGINSGNGKAKITYLSEVQPIRKNDKLNNVRYIKDCINGSSLNVNNHWVELQAIVNGNNVAKDKPVIGTSYYNPVFIPYSAITDGNITSLNYSTAVDPGLQCITVDLWQTYNLDEIATWHYYADSRTYNSNTTYVSSNNYNWTIIKNTKEVETPNGKRISAYEYSDVDVTTNNIIYNNLVTNGSFENGSTNWTTYGTGMSSVANSSKYGSYLAFNYHGSQFNHFEEIVTSIPNHKYYASIWIYSNSVGNGVCYNDLSFTYSGLDHWNGIGGGQSNLKVWEKKSQIYTSPNVATQSIKYAALVYNGTDSLSDCYADGALLVDLTATFGAGNEPTKEWCDANLNYVDTTGYTKIYQN